MTNREKLDAAVRRILNNDIFVDHIRLPGAAEAAAIKIFMDQIEENDDTRLIRAQLFALHTKGQFD